MRCPVAGLVAAFLLAPPSPAQKNVDQFADKEITVDGGSRRYRLLEPVALEPGAGYPLLVFLHGAGERGDDNRRQLIWLGDAMASEENRRRYPCYLLAVQCPEGAQWVEVAWAERQSTPMAAAPTPALHTAIAALRRTMTEHPVDADRVYLTGLSMGGYGVWDLACRHPEWFAAVAPVCGGGDERMAHRLARVPVWAFHGAEDPVVPPIRTASMIAALRAAGGDPRHTEVAGRGHDSWRDAYGEDGVVPWLFTQDRREQGRSAPPPPALVPWPRKVAIGVGRFVLGGVDQAVVVAEPVLRPLGELLRSEVRLLTGGELALREGEARDGDVVLALDPELAPGYRLEVDARVRAIGRSYVDTAMATVTWLQSLERLDGNWSGPRLQVADAPAFSYRAVMIDCARHPQSIDTLEQVVELCRWYKIRYLQLHLTDNEAFTFPCQAYPEATTAGRSYTLQELQGLEEFARVRGVAIVPELDVPGHSAALVKALPERFGLQNRTRNGGLVNMGREAVYAGLDRLVGEMCAVFASSPYFHIGGDEAWLADVDTDPDAIAYMERHGLSGPEELARHFLVRMHEIVKRHGKQTLVWEGFGRSGEVEIPKDVIVLAWESAYCRPDALVEDGYRVVNASWQPLYIVGGGKMPPHAAPKLWPVEHLYRWHPRRWEHFAPRYPSFDGIEVGTDAPVLGAQICVWEQLEHSTVELLRPRVAAVAERLWNPEAGRSFGDFARRLPRTDAAAVRLLRPVTILPRPAEPLPAHRFVESATVTIVATAPGAVRFTLDGGAPQPESPLYDEPFDVDRTTMVRARLFDDDGRARGGGDRVLFEKESGHRVRYTLYRAPRTGWKAVPDFRSLQPYFTGTAPGLRGATVSLPVGMLLEASLEIPADGEYRFKLESADGPSRLLIDDALVCDQERHWVWDGVEGAAVLAAGTHALRVEYAQGCFHTLCRVFYRAPGAADWRPVEELLDVL